MRQARQDGVSVGTVADAEAIQDRWARDYEEQRRDNRDNLGKLSIPGLIALAKDGDRFCRLTSGQVESFDEQWTAAFGFSLFREVDPTAPQTENDGHGEMHHGASSNGVASTHGHGPAPADLLPADDTMIAANEVCRMMGVHKATLRRMVDEGRFSAPHRPTERIRVWPARVVKEWLAEHGPRHVLPRVSR